MPPAPDPALPLLAPSGTPSPLLSAEERQAAEAIVTKVNAHGIVTAEDLRTVEGLFARYPSEPAVANLLLAALLNRAQNLRLRHDEAAAEAPLVRACALRPSEPAPWLALLDLQLARSQWAAAEQTARTALRLAPTEPAALQGLGQALMRLGRDQEASEALERSGTAQAQLLLGKIRKGLLDESGMRQQQLATFTLRYDGDAHEALGHEVLRIIERHFATLTLQFGHRPAAPIQVILYTNERFHEATAAPQWAGGLFDNIDGRVRVPVGGLTPAVTPEIENVLLHELTHAFVADITHGTATRELHEGLAQYMEGKRLESYISARHLTALADGQVGGVPGLYLGALAFVEYLVDQRGQGGINDLLKRMGETRDVDSAFRSVYGQTHRELYTAAQERLRQRYGS